jgi:2-dehydropantoate 2-reductase
MKILIAGAGAIGGYLAARLLEAGLNVSLLVRDRRKSQLEREGLTVISPLGDFRGNPDLLVSGQDGGPFDLVVIATKATGLSELVAQLRPYLHARTLLLPFLNGFRHMDLLKEAYPGQPLLGGVARIETTLDEEGRIVHLSGHHYFAYGRFESVPDDLYEAVRHSFSRAPVLTEKTDIEQELWDKYCFINAVSGMTTLMQATVGDIRSAPDGKAAFERVLQEASAIIEKAGGRLSPNIIERHMKVIEGMSERSTSSMHRDMQKGLPTESEHIQGVLAELARLHSVDAPLIRAMRLRLHIYEQHRSVKG